VNLFKELVSILTICVSQKPRGEPFQARPMSLCLVGHHPIRSEVGGSNGPGLNCFFTPPCPRFPRLAPWFWHVY
jgi:hypothetical protein